METTRERLLGKTKRRKDNHPTRISITCINLKEKSKERRGKEKKKSIVNIGTRACGTVSGVLPHTLPCVPALVLLSVPVGLAGSCKYCPFKDMR